MDEAENHKEFGWETAEETGHLEGVMGTQQKDGS
jgi:hypothetical protein